MSNKNYYDPGEFFEVPEGLERLSMQFPAVKAQLTPEQEFKVVADVHYLEQLYRAGKYEVLLSVAQLGVNNYQHLIYHIIQVLRESGINIMGRP